MGAGPSAAVNLLLAIAAAGATAPSAVQEAAAPPGDVPIDEAQMRRALRALRRGEEVDANVALLLRAVEQVEEPGRLARDVGMVLLSEQNWADAQAFLEIARDRLPADGFVAQQLGNAHVMQYHYAEAHEHLTAAEALLPPGPRPLLQLYLSMVLVGLQRMAQAEARALEAIAEAAQWNATAPAERRVDPVDFQLNLANVHQKWLRFDDALAVLERLDEAAMEPRDRTKACLVRAQLEEAKGDDEAALAAWRRALELAPGDPRVAYDFALYHVRRDRPEAARPLLELAATADPDHEGAHFNLARVLARLGERAAADASLARWRRIQAARFQGEQQLAAVRLRMRERGR